MRLPVHPLWLWMPLLLLSTTWTVQVSGNPHAKRLYDDLLSNYNRLIRPVTNLTDKLTVKLGLKLSQLMDVDLKNQIMTTNVWVEQKWMDYKLVWDPEDYGGVDMLFVPSQHIWLPDIVLFNNADGKYEVTLMTKASLKYTGEVVWKPPAIYKSSCKINVEWFPFDEQSCDMKFGSWTYDGNQLDLKHVDQVRGSNIVNLGIDLSEFYLSVEWDILEVPATRNEEYYIPLSKALILEERAEQIKKHGVESLNLDEEELNYRGELLTDIIGHGNDDITFYMTLRRKTLFYTVNLIIPCVGISFLTVLVFYLPSDSGEKVTLCISILLSLTVFFLLLAEIIPPTSLAVPLLGKYLLFTMILVSASICVTVGVLNIHFRSPATHQMSPWAKKVFIDIMPKILFMQRPHYMPRYTAVPPDPPSKDDDKGDKSSKNSTLDRRRPNGDVRGGGRKWSEDLDDMDDCTSRCHHHPHLTRNASPNANSTLRSNRTGTAATTTTVTSNAAGGGTVIHHHHHHHHHHVATGNSLPTTLTNHVHAALGSNHVMADGVGTAGSRGAHNRFVGPPNGALPPEPPDLELALDDDLDVDGSECCSPDGKSSVSHGKERGARRRKSSTSSYHAKPLSQVAAALKGVEYIAQHIKKQDKDIEVIEDWKFIAMVLDRLFLFLFMAACLLGTGGIILRAPSLYDMREPIGMTHSSIGLPNSLPKSSDYTYDDEEEDSSLLGGEASATAAVEMPLYAAY